MVTEELGSACHVKDEERGGEEERLVHVSFFPTFPLFSRSLFLSLSLSLNCSLSWSGEGGWEDEGEGMKAVAVSPSSHWVAGVCTDLHEDDSSYLVEKKNKKRGMSE